MNTMEILKAVLDGSLEKQAPRTKDSRAVANGKKNILSPKWTEEEDIYLLAHAKTHTGAEIATALNRSKQAVYHRSKKLNANMVKRGIHHWAGKLTDEDVDLIRELHEDGMGVMEIANKFDVSHGHVSDICQYMQRVAGVPINS